MIGEHTGIEVRPAVSADEAQWRELWQTYCDFYGASIPEEATNELWRRILDPNHAVNALVATIAIQGERRQIAGFANYVLHPYTWGTEPICYLEDLFVSEAVRGRGAGSALIEELIRLSRRNGWPRLYWHTHETNEVARSLYEQFTPTDPFVRYLIKMN